MIQNTAEALKGMIEYPCRCGPKILVYKGTCGKVSVQCPVCKRYALFDYDLMVAIPCQAAKGAVHNLRQKQ